MTISLIPIIADLTGAAASAEFPGLNLPALTNGYFARRPPSDCANCARSVSDHLVWTHVDIGPAYNAALWIQEFIDKRNALVAHIRKLASLIQLCHLTTNGILWSDTLGYAGYPPCSNEGGWEVTGSSAGEISLRLVAGSSDPRDIVYSELRENPDFVPGGTEPHYKNYTYRAAFPARGVLTLNNSILGYHGGWIVRGWFIPENLAVGDTFTAYVETPTGAGMTTVWPGSTGAVTATYRFYALADEGWNQPKDFFGFFGRPRSKTITISPGDTEVTVSADSKVKIPDSSGTWFTGSYGDVLFINRLKVRHKNSINWDAIIDLTGIEITETTQILITYWDASNLASSICIGSDRCKWSRQDYTNSYGETDDYSNKWYCAKGNDLRNLGPTGEAWLAKFRANCYQNECPLWAADVTPPVPIDETVIRKLIYGHPWRLIQLTVGVAQYYLERLGPPGMASLAEQTHGLPTGNHQDIDLDFAAGGWPQIREWIESGETLIHAMSGFEFLNLLDTGVAAVLGTSEPDYGPSGGLITGKVSDYGTAALDATTDPHKCQRACLGFSGPDISKYGHAYEGECGKGQRFVTYWAFFPRLVAGDAVQTFNEGTVQRGYWTAGFVACTEFDAWIYRLKITLNGFKFDKYTAGGTNRWGGLMTTATIKSAAFSAGVLTLALAHKTLTASSNTGEAGEEYSTIWAQGGTNVAPPEYARVNNWACSQSAWGPGRFAYLYPGCAIKFTGAGFAGQLIQNRKFLCSYAKAAGSATTDDWIPTAETRGREGLVGGYYAKLFSAQWETLSSVTVTRNGGATTLAGIQGQSGQARRYGLLKDSYFYVYGVNASGQKGVWIYFSPKQATSLSADKVLAITIHTDGNTYTASVNLDTDADYGWDTHLSIGFAAPAGQTIVSLDSVVVTDSNGVDHALTAYSSEPTWWADWDITHYWVSASSDTARTIQVPPEFAGNNVRIVCTISDYAGNNAAYYAAKVSGPHSASLPANHETIFDNCDEIKIQDEGGLIAAAWAALGAGGFADQALEAYTNPIGLDNDVNVYDGDPAASDTEIAAGDLTALMAHGEIWAKQNIVPGHCAVVRYKAARRYGELVASDLNAITRCLEKVMGGDGE